MGEHRVAGPFPCGPKRPSGRRTRAPSPNAFSATLELLGGFQLAIGGQVVHLPHSESRLLAALALRDRAQTRTAIAGLLWPDTTDDLAHGRLRTALWRLGRAGRRLLDVTTVDVALGPDVTVDVRELTARSHGLREGSTAEDASRLEVLSSAGELLPDWDEEWLVADRERVRQVRLYALEHLTEQLAREGRFGHAVETALMAVADDPLRESARRTLIRVFLAEGNVHDALVQYTDFRDVMRDDLGLDPSPQMEALLRDLRIGEPERPILATAPVAPDRAGRPGH